ncbi:MAG TPA: CotH kinase family protein, partial [Clostridia bacterium]|nr:CotH kinase family protein [Clostridia bacterium]
AQDQNRSKIRDELSTGLLEGTDVRFLFQAYKPYVLYLNGEYWGVYFLKEKRSRFFVAAHEGVVDSDSLDLLKASTQISHGSN